MSRDHSPIQIVSLVGSFRAGSLNQAILAAAHQTAPEGATIIDIDLRRVPFYDGDLEEAGPPDTVNALRSIVDGADGLLVITPEYNGSVPAVLKNAIDWASRGYPNAPIGGKLTAILGAGPGPGGTASAQEHMHQILARTGAVVIDHPTVQVARATERIVDGAVADAELMSEISAAVSALVTAICLTRDCGSISAVNSADVHRGAL